MYYSTAEVLLTLFHDLTGGEHRLSEALEARAHQRLSLSFHSLLDLRPRITTLGELQQYP